MSGCDWVELLVEHPEFAEKCEWEKLGVDDWSALLCKQPQFADKCDWKLFYLEDIVDLLKCLPQYAVRFDMDKLGNVHSDLWDEELRRRFDKCWDELIAKQPQLAKYRKPCPDYPERPPRNPQTIDISGALQL